VRRTALWAVAGLFALAGVLLVAPILTYPFGRDQGAFAAVADVIADGGLPYRDAWDTKPPGVYYLFWAGFAILGRSMFAARLFDVLWTLAAAVVLFLLGKRLLGRWAGAFGALFFLTGYGLGFDYWGTSQCDGFASLPLALAAAATAAAERRRSPAWAAWCGVCVGIATVLKVTLGAFLLVPLLAVVASTSEPVAGRLRRAAAYLLGCLAVIALVVTLMWRAGGLHDMLYVLLEWDPRYAELRSRVPLAIRIPKETFLFLFGGQYVILKAIGILTVVGCCDLIVRSGASRLRWLVPGWALAALLGIYVQGKFFPYHWLPLLPPMGLLAGQGLMVLWRAIRMVGSRPLKCGAGAGLALILMSALGAGYWLNVRDRSGLRVGGASSRDVERRFGAYGGGDFSFKADAEVASFLKEQSAPTDRVFIWGFESLVYFLADRRPASRFIHILPVVTQWSRSEARTDLLRDLDRSRPRYILVLHDDVFPWATGTIVDSATHLQAFPELTALLERDYTRVQRIEDFDIYEHREGDPEEPR
jgi:4-amino-4-deoxy-L-arabinose transferase-like glycosyltransferase